MTITRGIPSAAARAATPRLSLLAVALLVGCTLPGGMDGRYGEASMARATTGVDAAPTPFIREPLATGWGPTLTSRVTATEFRRAAPAPAAEDAVRYGRTEDATRLGATGKPRRRSMPLGDGRLEVAIESHRGRPFPVASSPDGPVVLGRDGETFRIRIGNRTPRRLEVVVSVDGLDVIDGTPASATGRGYILAPRGELLVHGWRRDTDTVAAFVFGRTTDSYTARRHGDTRNAGVFGFAVFEERTPPPPPQIDRPFATPPPPRNPDPFPADPPARQ